jgi:hypothetical protein
LTNVRFEHGDAQVHRFTPARAMSPSAGIPGMARHREQAMAVKRAVIAAIVGQFGHPRGMAGSVAGWVMARRPSNRQRNRWVVSLLDVQPTDRVLEIGAQRCPPDRGPAPGRWLHEDPDRDPRPGPTRGLHSRRQLERLMFRENRRTKISTLMLSCLGLFMVLLDITIVNNALPSIQRHLGASLSGLQWIIDAYTLVFASLLLTTGALSDRQGRKHWFLTGLAVFTLGSALCGLAPNLGVLAAARALQETGGAALLPASLSLLTSAFPNPRERAQAIGLWSGVSGLSLTAGPLIGGTLVDGPGWRWVFFINLPVGVVTFLAALRRVKESVNPRPRRLDPVGQLLAIGTLATLVYALIEGSAKGWTSGLIVTMFALAALGLVAFLVVEARQDQPMIELRLFGSPSFSGPT